MEIHGKLVDIHNQTIFAASVAVEGGRIVDIRRNSHRGTLFILPGFYDAHAHLETTHMIPSEFAHIAACHGTVATTFATGHLTSTLGPEAMALLRQNAARVPFKALFAGPQAPTGGRCSTLSEGRARQRAKEPILIDEANLSTLLPLLNEEPKNCRFCSNHCPPSRLVLGHIDRLIKRAIALGADPIDAITCGTYQMGSQVGLLRVGDPADCVLVDNLKTCRVLETYIDGMAVFKGHALLPRIPFHRPKAALFRPLDAKNLSTLQLEGELSVFTVTDQGPPYRKRFLPPEGGAPDCNPAWDLLKLIKMDKAGRPQLALVEGFGLKRGALASTLSGSPIAVGTSDRDIISAINAVIGAGGGISISCLGTTDLLPLPIGGLLSPADGKTLAHVTSELEAAAQAMGSTLKRPFHPLAFL